MPDNVLSELSRDELEELQRELNQLTANRRSEEMRRLKTQLAVMAAEHGFTLAELFAQPVKRKRVRHTNHANENTLPPELPEALLNAA